MLRRCVVAGIIASVLMLVGASVAAAACGPTWSVQTFPAVPHNGRLLDVSCPSVSGCVAVGATGTYPFRGWVEDWNGSAWSVEVLPASLGFAYLASVSCPSTRWCMAVGFADSPSDPVRPLAAEWDGGRWSVSYLQQAPSVIDPEFTDVSCGSPTACIAVGGGEDPTSPTGSAVPAAEVWNGRTWSAQSAVSTNADPGLFFGVSCAGPAACLAVGSAAPGVAWNWNGSRWTRVPDPPGTLFAVSCRSSDWCVAVGYDSQGNGFATVWDGRSWQVGLTTSAGDLEDVSCTQVDTCMAVGTGAGGLLAERWNGGRWTTLTTPSTGRSPVFPSSISCTTNVACTAVTTRASSAPLIERYGWGRPLTSRAGTWSTPAVGDGSVGS